MSDQNTPPGHLPPEPGQGDANPKQSLEKVLTTDIQRYIVKYR
jgi:hypothetical protein